MQKLVTAIIQTHLTWENIDDNIHRFTKKINNIKNKVDLIILPEMFTTGFTMQPEKVVKTNNDKTIKWMQEMAYKHKSAITGSVAIAENGNFFNRLFFVKPNGSTKHYDKRHTFTLAGENKIYTAGTKQLLVEYKGWKIYPQICYDLRFPVWNRNTMNYDMVLYVANWPKSRIYAWDTLLKARAIENMSYCIGVNRVGTDPKNEYNGHSAAYNSLGEPISNLAPNEDSVEIVTLDKNHLIAIREKLQFLKDRDNFVLEV